MRVADFLAAFDRVAPASKAATWDPVGLQLGDPGAELQSVAVCHEVTEAVVSEIEERGAGLLVAYHPLLFRPVARLVADRSPAGRAFRLIRAGAALAVTHTNFDVAPGGAADALAESLDLVEISGFGPVETEEGVKVVTFVPSDQADLVADAMAGAGAGRIGNYSHCSYRIRGTGTFFPEPGSDPVTGRGGELNREPEERLEMIAPRSAEDRVISALVAAHPYEEPAFDVYPVHSNTGLVGRIGILSGGPTTLGELAVVVGERMGSAGLRVTGDRSAGVGRVAVVPGSGSSYLKGAAAAGADVMVTGDVPHHRAVEAGDDGLAVIDPGHLATERAGVARLYAAVAAIFPGAVDLTTLDLEETTG